MGLVREKMVEDMKLRGFSQHTQKCYLQYVRLFVVHYRRSPTELGEEEVRKFLMYLVKKRQVKPSTIRMYIAALKFLYGVTLDRPGVVDRIPWPKVPKKLPDILSGAEVDRVLASLHSLKHRAILMVAYGCGLRISEACSLQVTDVDSNRGFIHVRQGKGDKDRYVLLPQRLLFLLREYWKTSHPPPGSPNSRRRWPPSRALARRSRLPSPRRASWSPNSPRSATSSRLRTSGCGWSSSSCGGASSWPRPSGWTPPSSRWSSRPSSPQLDRLGGALPG